MLDSKCAGLFQINHSNNLLQGLRFVNHIMPAIWNNGNPHFFVVLDACPQVHLTEGRWCYFRDLDTNKLITPYLYLSPLQQNLEQQDANEDNAYYIAWELYQYFSEN